MDATSAEQATSAGAISPAGTAKPWLIVFNRIFSRHLMNMAVLMLLPMLFATSLGVHPNLMQDPDIWFHLANARLLITTHHFIYTEPYAFTVVGQEWVNWEWLGELPYWFSYHSFGLRGIYLVTWLALCANVLFIYWRSYWAAGHAGAAFWASAIGFLLMTINSGPRTIAFAYLAMSSEMAILEATERGKSRLLWFLPPIFCLWINLHGSWLIGVGLFGLYTLCGLFQFKMGVFEQDAFPNKKRNQLLAVLGVSLIALIINPYGWRLIRNPFDTMLNLKQTIATGQEWQPLNLAWINGKFAVLAIGLMIVAGCIRARKWKVYELAFVFFAWYAAFSTVRFLFLAAVVTTPLLAKDLNRIFFAESDKKTVPAMNALMVAGAVCVMLFMFPSEATLRDSVATKFPLESIRAIQPSWRTLNVDNLGGMMDFNSKPTFIDTRLDTFEHHGILKDFLDVLHLRDPLPILDKYQIDHALLRKGTPFCDLLEHTPGWQVERQEGTGDDVYELFVKLHKAGRDVAPICSNVAKGM